MAVWHDRHASKCAAEEYGNPLGRVLAPEHYPVALGDAPRFQFASQAKGQLQDVAICERFGPVSAALAAGALVAMCLKIFQEELYDRCGHSLTGLGIRGALQFQSSASGLEKKVPAFGFACDAEGEDALGTAGKLPALRFYSLPTPSASATRLM